MDRVTARQIIARLNADAAVLAGRFGLRYASITAERKGVNGHYGICYSDGTIKIRLRHAVTGKPLKYSSLVNTLCHELAHLRHFNHGPRFKAFYFEILDFARDQGIYRPGPTRRERPEVDPAIPQPAPVPREARPPRGRKRSNASEGPKQLSLFG